MLKPRRRRGSDRGLSLVLMSLLLVTMLGIAGLVVDLGSWQVQASRIQQAADAAALAGVVRLPDGVDAARHRARAVAADNGYEHGVDGVTVDAEPAGDETLAVTVTKTGIPRYFTQVVRGGTTTITRRATAQYVQPVPMGSARNYLGTGDLLAGHPGVNGDGVENFWLSVSGKCTRREYGDRITPKATANAYGPHSCTIGDRGTLENEEENLNGYLFAVTVPEANLGNPVDIQMFDAPVCTDAADASNKSRPGDAEQRPADQEFPAFDVFVSVRDDDDLNPLQGTLLFGDEFLGSTDTSAHCAVGGPATGVEGGECAATAGGPLASPLPPSMALRNCWVTLTRVTTAGTYYINVNPEDRAGSTRHDSFSLRAKTGGIFTPCTSDSTAPAGSLPLHQPWCPQVYGFEHLPVFSNLNAMNPTFFLTSIDSRHNGKVLEVTLYDAAEGATGIQLLDPLGGAVSFEWEVLCSDGSPEPPSSGCDPPETPPQGGVRRGPMTTELDVADDICPLEGCAQPFENNRQPGRYSDRLLRLRHQLDGNMAATYMNRTWWKIKYIGNFGGDRTTWSVKVLGDPVRLVPNAAPTTTSMP